MTKDHEQAVTSTLSEDFRRTGKGHLVEPFIFVAFHADDPGAPVSRHALGDVDEIQLRRGTTRGAIRLTDGPKRQLVLTFPDRWMSGMHAYVRRRGSGFCVDDAGSKNGTVVDGKRVVASPISNGSLLEVGHTFLLFKGDLPISRDASRDYVPADQGAPHRISTLSPLLGRAFQLLADVAPSTISVLLRGETGTGKDVVSEALHRMSSRKGAFVAVNCGAIPSTLIESELFGFRKGAFSGAIEDRVGLARAADGGTLFLDEIGDLPQTAQTAFLRVLQERKVVPIGSVSPVSTDFRLVAATHKNLETLLARGEFREDLLARLNGLSIQLPPLRERREDLGLLVAQLLSESAHGAASVTFSVEAVRALFAHSWPQNVRELGRRLALALVVAKGSRLEREHLFGLDLGVSVQSDETYERIRSDPPAGLGALEPEDRIRRERLVALLREHKGNVTAVARAMGKARAQVQRWMRRYGVNRRTLVSG